MTLPHHLDAALPDLSRVWLRNPPNPLGQADGFDYALAPYAVLLTKSGGVIEDGKILNKAIPAMIEDVGRWVRWHTQIRPLTIRYGSPCCPVVPRPESSYEVNGVILGEILASVPSDSQKHGWRVALRVDDTKVGQYLPLESIHRGRVRFDVCVGADRPESFDHLVRFGKDLAESGMPTTLSIERYDVHLERTASFVSGCGFSGVSVIPPSGEITRASARRFLATVVEQASRHLVQYMTPVFWGRSVPTPFGFSEKPCEPPTLPSV